MRSRPASPVSSLVLTLLTCASANAANAQDSVASYTRVPGEVRNGGTYHVSTGTWTRAARPASAWATANSDIVFNNTVPSGYSWDLAAGEVIADEGRLPSKSSPESVWNPLLGPAGIQAGSARGSQDAYAIDGFQIGYCSDAIGATTQVSVSFWASWNPSCSADPQGSPAATFALTGLPGTVAPALSMCWTVNVDATGGASFVLPADGDGHYDDGFGDRFGWAFTFPSITSTTSSTSRTGPLIAGCPVDHRSNPYFGWTEMPWATLQEAAGYDGTRFDGPPGATAPTWPLNGAVGLPQPGGECGTGMGADDHFRTLASTRYPPGCYNFGGSVVCAAKNFPGPFASFHLELYSMSVAAPVPTPGFGDCYAGSTTNVCLGMCPCGPFATGNHASGHGCPNSVYASGALLRAEGSPPADDVVLFASAMPGSASAIFLKGDAELPTPVTFGDGLRCVDGTLIRLRVRQNAAGAASFPDSTDTQTLSQRGQTPPGSGLVGYYQVYYRNAATFCTSATFNVTNGYVISW